MSRIKFLDTLRAFAVLLVSMGHIIVAGSKEKATLTRFFGEATKESYPILSSFNYSFLQFLDFLNSAGVGVCLFFLITGYIIPLTMLKKSNKLDFLISRFFRIFPPALLVLVVVHVFLILTFNINFNFADFCKSYIDSLFPGSIRQNSQLFASDFIFFHSPQSFFLHFFEPFWTLSIEIIFYILIACIEKEINFWSVILTQIMFALFYLRTKFACFGFIAFILFGSLFLFIETEFKKENKFSKKIICKILVFFIVLALFLQLNKIGHIYSEKAFTLSLSIFVLFYFVHLKFCFPKMITKIIDFIADISYSFYLLHFPIGMGFALFIKLHYNITNPYIQVFSAFALSFIVSYLCYLIFERSSIKLGKYLINKYLTK